MMAETDHPRWTRGETIAVSAVAWILAALLAVFGTSKLMATEMQVAAFQSWGYPLWFMYAVGAAEVTAALLLTVPETTFYGGALALGVLAGAIATLLAAGQYAQLPLPAVTGAAAGLLAVLRRPAWLSGLDAPARSCTPGGPA